MIALSNDYPFYNLSQDRQAIVSRFPIALIEALGGFQAINNYSVIPHLRRDSLVKLSPQDVHDSISIGSATIGGGYDCHAEQPMPISFVVLRWKSKLPIQESPANTVHVEVLQGNPRIGWTVTGSPFGEPDFEEDDWNRYALLPKNLEYLARLVQGSPCGSHDWRLQNEDERDADGICETITRIISKIPLTARQKMDPLREGQKGIEGASIVELANP